MPTGEVHWIYIRQHGRLLNVLRTFNLLQMSKRNVKWVGKDLVKIYSNKKILPEAASFKGVLWKSCGKNYYKYIGKNICQSLFVKA